MIIIKGIISSQPRLWDGVLVFTLDYRGRALTVIRQQPEEQKKDIVFLCVGMQVLLWGEPLQNNVIAHKVRILDCTHRNYIKE